jgi:hypothetical protein
MRLRHARLLELLGVALLLIVSFQNCARLGFNSGRDAESQKMGGTGTDGKVYASYDVCNSGQVDVASKVLISSDGQSASVLRANCIDLHEATPVALTDLQFASDDNSIFKLDGKVFDEQKGLPDQRVTTELCGAGATEVRVWKTLTSPSAIFAKVAQANGAGSEVLLMEATAGGYQSLPAQPSRLNLAVSNGTASLSYAIDGGTPQSVSGLNCVIQPMPPPTPPQLALAPPPGYTANLLIFEDRFSGPSLDSSKWIPQIADQNGIFRQSVPAPYSATNAGGYNAEFYDPAHVLTGPSGLSLIATRDSTFPGYSWRSACVSTHGLFYLQSGYLQFRARFPDSSSGMWASVHLEEGGASLGVAISGFLGSGNVNQVVSMANGNSQFHVNTGKNLSAGYHVYGIEYRPGVSVKTYVDGVLTATFTNNIPTGAYEVVINLQVAQNAETWHTVTSAATPLTNEFNISEIQAYQLP